MRRSLLTLALAVVAWSHGSYLQAAENVIALRIASLDAMLADGERIAEATGQTNSRKQMLAGGLGALGLADADWVDGTRPIVVSVPQEALATMGWVGALPVADVESALQKIEGQLGEHEVSDGIHSFASSFGARIHVRAQGDYLLVGMNQETVGQADLNQLLDVGDLPPGSVALDIDLVPMTPMIQLGLAMGRQTIQQSVEEDDSSPGDSETVLSMVDLYLDVVNDTVLNTSRVQISLELGDDSVLFHKRLLPRSDSTLAGLLQAQKGGLPDIARRVEATSATAMMFSNIKFTPEFRAALKTFAQRYLETMRGLSEVLPEDETVWWDAMLEPFEGVTDSWVDCFRGDTAVTYEFGSKSGFRATQLTGFTDGEACGKLVDEMAKSLADLPAPPDGERVVAVTPNALTHSGVGATRFSVKLDSALAAEHEESRQLVQQLLGGDAYLYYLGVTEDLLLSTVGAGAEQAFRDAVDRLGSRSKRTGMTPRMFAPLETGPGFFAVVDLARMFHEVAELDPDDADLQALKSIPKDRGKFVMGVLGRKGSLDFDLSFPLGFFEAIRALDAQGEAEPEENPAVDAAPDAAVRS
jgi:hypothetical protein